MADDDQLDGLDGLDDFGDDFGDQLDSFMEGEGDEDGDSELDSFFEDLSTIDDLEVQDDAEDEPEPAPAAAPASASEAASDDEDDDPPLAAAATAGASAAAAAAVKPMPKASKSKGGGKSLLPAAIIASVTGLLLGVITVVILYLLQGGGEVVPEEPPIVMENDPVLMPEPMPPPEPEPEPEPVKPRPQRPAPPPPPQRFYYVQVANCVHQECVDDYRFLLQRFGYPIRVDRTQELTPMTEIISREPMGEEATGRMIDRINRENRMAGRAFRKEADGGYLISLGLFPDLDTANRVKNNLNQAYAKEVFFEATRADQKIVYLKVRAGGFRSKNEAERLKDLLAQKDERFEGAFVIAMRR